MLSRFLMQPGALDTRRCRPFAYRQTRPQSDGTARRFADAAADLNAVTLLAAAQFRL